MKGEYSCTVRLRGNTKTDKELIKSSRRRRGKRTSFFRKTIKYSVIETEETATCVRESTGTRESIFPLDVDSHVT